MCQYLNLYICACIKCNKRISITIKSTVAAGAFVAFDIAVVVTDIVGIFHLCEMVSRRQSFKLFHFVVGLFFFYFLFIQLKLQNLCLIF